MARMLYFFGLFVLFFQLSTISAHSRNADIISQFDYFSSTAPERKSDNHCDYFFDLFDANQPCPVGSWFNWGYVNEVAGRWDITHAASYIAETPASSMGIRNRVIMTFKCEWGYNINDADLYTKHYSISAYHSYYIRDDRTKYDSYYYYDPNKGDKLLVDGSNVLSKKIRSTQGQYFVSGSARRLSKLFMNGGNASLQTDRFYSSSMKRKFDGLNGSRLKADFDLSGSRDVISKIMKACDIKER